MANEDVDVHSLAVDCHMILENLASKKLNDDEADPKRLADTLGNRLNAWGNHLEGFAGGSASLAHQLQDSPKVKKSITQSLSQLHKTLQILIEKTPGTTGSQSSPEQGHLQSENNSDRRLLYEAADRTVDRLERFGRIIQRSSVTEIQDRMELYAKEDPSAIKSQGEQWDGPYFHEQYGLWYQQKPDKSEPGGIKYEWIGTELPGQEKSEPDTPRQVDKTTKDLGNLNIDDNTAEYSGIDNDSYLSRDPLSDYTYKGKGVKQTAYPDDTYPAGESSYGANVPGLPTYDFSSAYPYDLPEDLSQNAYRESEQAAEHSHRSEPSKSAQVSTPPVHQVPLLGTNAPEPPPTIEETVRQDERYRVENSSKWKKGEVIKCLTAEPRGTQHRRDASLTDFRPHNSLQDFYVGPRRFIIVKTSHGRSTCVPVCTYGGQGCNKPGLLPETHSVVYSSTSKPLLLPGEPRPGYPPIAVNMTGHEELAMESRVDYSNMKTFEHNVPVIFIGSIEGLALATVRRAVDECWADDQWPTRKAKWRR